jgi:hypothetical protein
VITIRAKVAFFGGVTLVYATILLYSNFLQFPLYGDELHFWPTTLSLFNDGLPSLEQLRTYNELNTPLPFLIFGTAEHFFHGGIVVGRVINLLFSIALVLLIGAAGRFSLHSALCIAGLVVFPYFLGVSTHLYTDITAVTFTVAGVALFLNKRHGLSALFFVLGIACRQYVIAFPVAIFAYDLTNRIASNQLKWDWSWIAPLLACLSLGGWYLFFGAMAPQTALHGQNIVISRWYPDHGLYFLTCIGLFFVVIEMVFFRSFADIKDVTIWKVGIALIVSVLFYLFPPVVNVNTITDTMGYLDRGVRLILDDSGRMILFWALAMLACLRFRPFSFVGMLLYANSILMIKAHVGWDKYALPLLAVLWLLKSADRFDLTPEQLVD